jgi:hypothetical protein
VASDEKQESDVDSVVDESRCNDLYALLEDRGTSPLLGIDASAPPGVSVDTAFADVLTATLCHLNELRQRHGLKLGSLSPHHIGLRVRASPNNIDHPIINNDNDNDNDNNNSSDFETELGDDSTTPMGGGEHEHFADCSDDEVPQDDAVPITTTVIYEPRSGVEPVLLPAAFSSASMRLSDVGPILSSDSSYFDRLKVKQNSIIPYT